MVHDFKFFTVTVDLVKKPNGDIGTYSILRAKLAPMVIPVDAYGNIHMIEEPRYALDNKLSVAFPMGMINEGESIEDAARRELEEELTGQVIKLIPLGVIHGADGVSEHKTYVFIGQGFHFIENPKLDPEDEGTIRHHVFTVEELWEKIDNEEIFAAEALAGILKYLRYLKKL